MSGDLKRPRRANFSFSLRAVCVPARLSRRRPGGNTRPHDRVSQRPRSLRTYLPSFRSTVAGGLYLYSLYRDISVDEAYREVRAEYEQKLRDQHEYERDVRKTMREQNIWNYFKARKIIAEQKESGVNQTLNEMTINDD